MRSPSLPVLRGFPPAGRFSPAGRGFPDAPPSSPDGFIKTIPFECGNLPEQAVQRVYSLSLRIEAPSGVRLYRMIRKCTLNSLYKVSVSHARVSDAERKFYFVEHVAKEGNNFGHSQDISIHLRAMRSAGGGRDLTGKKADGSGKGKVKFP
jgi:hypothetical protein